jgi:hypothetical protein
MHTEVRSIIRSQITPFAHVQTYPTGWGGRQTSAQLYDDLVEYATNVMKRNGLQPDERPECLQIGFTALLETLKTQHVFLADKTRQQAVFFILARCKISSMRYQVGRYDSLDAIVSEDWHNTFDEHAIDGLQQRRGERWAGWATQIDMRVDIERVMCRLAEKYADSLQHLTALYYVTTQVSRADAAGIAGMTSWNWYKSYVLPVLAEVRYAFAEVFRERHSYPQPEPVAEPANKNRRTGRFASPYREWREAYRQGRTAPAEALLNRYAHTPCIFHALQAQIDGNTYAQAAIATGRNPKSFRRHMKRAAQLLAAAYA